MHFFINVQIQEMIIPDKQPLNDSSNLNICF